MREQLKYCFVYCACDVRYRIVWICAYQMRARIPQEDTRYPTYLPLIGALSCLVLLISSLLIVSKASTVGVFGLIIGVAYFEAFKLGRTNNIKTVMMITSPLPSTWIY